MNDAKDHGAKPRFALRRRELMKLGAGAGLTLPLIKPQVGSAQQAPAAPTAGLDEASKLNVQRWPDIRESQQVAATTQTGYTVSTGPGWVNRSGRALGTGAT